MEQFYSLPERAARLDLACEATAALRGQADVEIPGVQEDVSQAGAVRRHLITILNKEGSRRLNRPIGKYLTLELPPVEDSQTLAEIASVLSDSLAELLPPLNDGCLLLVGLGNDHAAPDALGPAVVAKSYATRHIFTAQTEPEGLAKVAAIAPGVLGNSGLETAQLIQGICQWLRPAAVLAVDALAAGSISRVGVTIQLTDSGICPGSGVGNSRPRLTAETLGCPVVALGIPTVIDTAAIISETLSALAEHWQHSAQILPPDLDDASCDYAEQKLLQTFHGNLMVTPKDIDQLIENMAQIVAAGLAMHVHPACTIDNYHDYIR